MRMDIQSKDVVLIKPEGVKASRLRQSQDYNPHFLLRS